MSSLKTLPLDDLDIASGGANTKEGKFNIGVDTSKTKIGIQGDYKQSTTDYASCLSTMVKSGAKPSEVKDACGLPGASK